MAKYWEHLKYHEDTVEKHAIARIKNAHIIEQTKYALQKKKVPDMERTECSEYVIDNYHAAQNRKKLRIVRSK